MVKTLIAKLRRRLQSGCRRMHNEEFIDFCYRKLLGREVDAEARRHLLAKPGRNSHRLQVVETILNSEEFLIRERSLRDPFVTFAPPGHFYSPLPAAADVQEKYERVLADGYRYRDNGVIDFNAAGQLALLDRLSRFYGELPFAEAPVPPSRYGYVNDQFGHGDAVTLYAMLRHFKPKRVVEVGSGHSSAVMLDTGDLFSGQATRLTFIEPFPERLYGLLRPADRNRCTILAMPVQDADPGLFQALEENDILFIDSSHVVKFGSDPGYLLFSIVPFLNPGVLIHFHDIFWPFEYPRSWLMEGRAWNESYLLKAFLAFNHRYQIIFFNDFLYHYHRDQLLTSMPILAKNPGCGIWLQKTA